MRYLAGVIAAAVLVLPASAAGATLGPDRPLVAGPAVAGDAVLVVTAAGRRGYEVLRLGADPPEVVTGRRLADVFGQRSDLRSARFDVLGSASSFAVLETGTAFLGRGEFEYTGHTLLSGRFDGGLEERDCLAGPVPPRAVLGAALDGDDLVVVESRCDEPVDRLLVRDLATGAERAIPLPEPPSGRVEVAGDLAAVELAARPAVQVVSLGTGAVLWEAPSGGDFVLDGTGRLLVLAGAGCGAGLTASSADAPPAAVPGAFCAGTLAADGGQPVVRAVTAGGRQVLQVLGGPVLARSDARGSGLLPEVDAADGRVAFALAGCASATVASVARVAPGPPATPVTRCPATVRRIPARVRASRLRVRVRCPAGCIARVAAGDAATGDVAVQGDARIVLGLPDRVLRRPRVRVRVAFRPRSDLPFAAPTVRRVRIG